MLLLAVKERKSSGNNEPVRGTRSGEVVAFCPQCQALQTVWVTGDKLMPTRKFSQYRGQVYHDCGSSQPCRLYRTLLGT